MGENETYRLNKVCRELSVGLETAVDFLNGAGLTVPKDPNHKISSEQYQRLKDEFSPETLADLQLKVRKAVENEDYHTATKLMKELKQYKTGDLQNVR